MRKIFFMAVGVAVVGLVTWHDGLFRTDEAIADEEPDGCAVTTIIPQTNGFYNVPAGCHAVKFRMWGQGGASWVTGEGGSQGAGVGGGSGYVFGITGLNPGFSTIGVSLPPFQQFGGGNGGGHSYIYQGSTKLAIAPGGGGAGRSDQLGVPGNGGPGGSLVGGETITNSGVTAYGGTPAVGDNPGSGGINNPSFPPCYGFTGGGGGCNTGGSGGGGWATGGGGAAAGINGSKSTPIFGAGGGGGSAYQNFSPYGIDWGLITEWLPGTGGQPGGTSDPYYGGTVGLGGVGSPNVLVTRGGPGKVVLTFGEDLTQAESEYPPDLSFGSFCPPIDPPPAPVVQGFAYPNNPPPPTCSSAISCRADIYDEGGVICSYLCGVSPNQTKYVFKSC